jgi:hypothetical protein
LDFNPVDKLRGWSTRRKVAGEVAAGSWSTSARRASR